MPLLLFLDSSPDYDHHGISNHLQIKHVQHNPIINQGSSKCCLSEMKGKTHVDFNEASLRDDGSMKCVYSSCSFISYLELQQCTLKYMI